MKADIVCEGGGVKGIALLGAIYYLEEKGYTFQNFAGTSAGAIVSSLLAVGYTGKELKELLLNILIFMKKTNYHCFLSLALP